MAMDINVIKDAIIKLTKDEEARKAFQADPVKEVERVTGLDLNDEEINAVINGVKAKLEGGEMNDILAKIGSSPLFDKITSMFNK
ncbi:MAG: hypothetical protein IJ062_08620 [Firmicutes bacterium]|nr:hypothetical protein [Bacillota bacterium]